VSGGEALPPFFHIAAVTHIQCVAAFFLSQTNTLDHIDCTLSATN
jgi:hypothetical protein